MFNFVFVSILPSHFAHSFAFPPSLVARLIFLRPLVTRPVQSVCGIARTRALSGCGCGVRWRRSLPRGCLRSRALSLSCCRWSSESDLTF
ncbi:hypothetical protein IWX49DRAFT_75858 [Phyllosticta citricarpa]|uniref:Secreted protein n=1 Tax=Phyllosticta citricarpa TaxID=55181 RepID=A0ABR1LRT4_9PEZI